MKTENKLKQALDFLGAPYRAQVIDFEDCIHRDLGNGFDIEVSGIGSPRPGAICGFVCVWRVQADGRATSIEYVRRPRTLEELKAVLDGLVEKYSVPYPSTEYADSEAEDWLRQLQEEQAELEEAIAACQLAD